MNGDVWAQCPMRGRTHQCGAPHDWRCTPITPGALVVYGAPVGRSIALVEALVDSETPFTKSGRVNLRVIRRAAGYGEMREVVHVGADRLTVISALPPSVMPTDAERNADAKRQREESEANRDSHTLDRPGEHWHAVCTTCGAGPSATYGQRCTGTRRA